MENAGKDEAQRRSSQGASQAHQKVEMGHANGEQQSAQNEAQAHN